MDPTTASYYRAILFVEAYDDKPLPPTLVLLHKWAIKRCQALGLGGTISKQTALSVAMMWMSTTNEGIEFTREFTTLGDIFGAPDDDMSGIISSVKNDDESADDENVVDWDALPVETKVIATKGGTQMIGEYVGRRSRAWIDVRIDGERQSFRPRHVQIAGA